MPSCLNRAACAVPELLSAIFGVTDDCQKLSRSRTMASATFVDVAIADAVERRSHAR